MSFGAPRLFIAGLGNAPYPSTRHSVGQLIVDALASRLGITLARNRNGISGEGYVTVGKTPVTITLFKSRRRTNEHLRALCRKRMPPNWVPPAAMLVIADSLSHKPMKLSVRLGGSANGHNGIKSVIAALGNQLDFWRLRAGVGREGNGDPSDYVLDHLPPQEIAFWKQEGLDQVLKEIEKIAKQQVAQ
ncbi:peptidyl-tRNA hydrolase [Mucidula mucida]|nr:peptidyl-tRNA hydrolase [Mucidula mucida]